MDELRQLCVRVLGEGEAARAAEAQATAQSAPAGAEDRLETLRAGVAAIRERARDGAAAGHGPVMGSEPEPEVATGAGAGSAADEEPHDLMGAGAGSTGGDEHGDLAAAVGRELEAATGELSERHREVLALRDLLELTHAQIAQVAGIAPDDVARTVARARLALREQLRGPGAPDPGCPERERALRTIALRQDGEAVPAADEDWLVEHLGHCRGCAQEHASMLEAAACYRAWRPQDGVPAGDDHPVATGSST